MIPTTAFYLRPLIVFRSFYEADNYRNTALQISGRCGFEKVGQCMKEPVSKGRLQIAPSDDRKGVQSVDRAFDMLGVFEQSEQPLSVKDISGAIGMTPPQVHHYLVSLTRSGAITRRPDSRYELGVFTLQLGLAALRRLEPDRIDPKRLHQKKDNRDGDKDDG